MTVKIVVAGDVSVDWYYWPETIDPKKRNRNWKLYNGVDINPQAGGAVLLAKWLSEILKIRPEGSFPYSLLTQSCEDLVRKSPGEVLHKNLYLDIFPSFSSGDRKDVLEVYRVKNCIGYTVSHNKEQFPVPLEIPDDRESADIVIIYDAGNGFRFQEQAWPKALKRNQKPIVIYYMCPPLFKGSLWDHITGYYKDKLILILDAKDLRKNGINISRSISWEKSAMEFLWEMNHKADFTEIKELNNVIIRFAYDGAVLYNGKTERSKLFFDPTSLEGEFWDYEKFGDMLSTDLVFIAYLTSCFLISKFKDKESRKVLEQGIKKGLVKAREYLIEGYGSSKDNPDCFKLACLNSSENKSLRSSAGYIAETLLPPIEEIDAHSGPGQSNSYFWTILQEKAKAEADELNKKSIIKAIEVSGTETDKNHSTYLEKLAFLIAIKGFSDVKDFPVGKFGKLTTVDRTEIESFRSIKNILVEYLHSEKNQKPLSIAVFGSPGSGKSFGITQVTESIDSERIEKVTFNISQFTSTKDLTNAFHRIRDISIKGKIPLVFFDEFDSKLETEELGWIKYFLVPMQDGEFLDLGSMHPLGRSIFVFAGSMCNNFNEFFNLCNNSNKQNKSYSETYSGANPCRMISNKCPDFLSRLRGYVNILGLNRTDEKDETYILRRAIQLRSLIEANAPNILKENHAHISCSLVNYPSLNLSPEGSMF